MTIVVKNTHDNYSKIYNDSTILVNSDNCSKVLNDSTILVNSENCSKVLTYHCSKILVIIIQNTCDNCSKYL